jgi:hypothetical protein
MRLSLETFVKRYGWATVLRQKAMRKVWSGVLEVGLWLQAEQRHRNDELVTKGYEQRRKWSKDRAAAHERIRGRYMQQAEIDRLMMKEVLRGANYGRGAVPVEKRRSIAISETEEKLTAVWEPRANWEPQGELFISSGKKIDLGHRERRGLDKIKTMRFRDNKPVLCIDPGSDEAIVVHQR